MAKKTPTPGKIRVTDPNIILKYWRPTGTPIAERARLYRLMQAEQLLRDNGFVEAGDGKWMKPDPTQLGDP